VFNGTTTTHTYGSDGLRRRTVEGSVTTDYVLDGQSVVRTVKNGALDRTYLHGLRGPEYERVGTADPVWYLYDGLGSVLGTVDAQGNLVSTRKYDVYGAIRGSTGPAGSNHRWVGKLGHPSEGETGLAYMRARYYDPVVGRFTSEDPAGQGANWYADAAGNPISSVDENGKQWSLSATLIGGAIFERLGSLVKTVFCNWLQSKATDPDELSRNVILGVIGGALTAPICLGAVGSSAPGIGKAVLAALGHAAASQAIRGIAIIGVAMLGLTFLAGQEPYDEDSTREQGMK